MTYGMLRVKNEARWISRVIRSIQPVCHEIIVLDDHSSDETPDICKSLGCKITQSPFAQRDETRDKNFLLRNLFDAGAKVGDFVLAIDGDEVLNPDDLDLFSSLLHDTNKLYSFKVEYLWDREDQLRVDRLYSRFRRPSLFPITSRNLTFESTNCGGNLHCGNVPSNLSAHYLNSEVRLIHFGYLHREDRIRKYNFYNSIDPNNDFEDCYRHIVCGDIPEIPANSELKWAGPLLLQPSPFRI
jgi:glycosyltransferase involved in cell wall biosynthesis